MNTLSREQIQKLSPEEQVALADFEAQEVRVHQRLVSRAGVSVPRDIFAGLLAGLAAGLAIYGLAQPKAIPFAIIVVIVFVGVHVKGIHNRLDALTQVLDLERTRNETPTPQSTQP